jgi:hypothetical protein
MTVDSGSPLPKPEDMTPPPRSVPFTLWCHLLAGPVTLAGSGVFAFGMLFAIVFVPATDLLGTWRLSQRRQEAPGWQETVEATNSHEGGDDGDSGTPIYRCDYSFRLPDGTALRGRSYTLGQQFQLHPAQPGGPAPRLAVTVEYDSQYPETNRIRGTRTSPYGPWALFVVVFPTVGLLIALGGLAVGRRRGRLLRDGEAVAARITTCRFGAGDDGVDLPVAAYKQQMGDLHRQFGRHPIVQLASGFLVVWSMLATAFLVFGTLFCVAMLVLVLFIMPMPARERTLFAMAIAGFLVLWVTMGLFMARSGWRAVRAARGGGAASPPQKPVRCAFEFRLPDGEVVQARAPGRLTDQPGDEPPQPALYDPARPSRALLLSGLAPAVRVGPYSGWETTAGAEAVLRLLVALLLLAGPVAVLAVLH